MKTTVAAMGAVLATSLVGMSFCSKTRSEPLLAATNSRAALDQPAIENASAIIVFTAVAERITVKYRERGVRYLHIELGHAAQNVALQAVSLAIGTVPIGAFNDRAVAEIVGCEASELPLYLMPVGAIN